MLTLNRVQAVWGNCVRLPQRFYFAGSVSLSGVLIGITTEARKCGSGILYMLAFFSGVENCTMIETLVSQIRLYIDSNLGTTFAPF
jgi:hypothetical protein